MHLGKYLNIWYFQHIGKWKWPIILVFDILDIGGNTSWQIFRYSIFKKRSKIHQTGEIHLGPKIWHSLKPVKYSWALEPISNIDCLETNFGRNSQVPRPTFKIKWIRGNLTRTTSYLRFHQAWLRSTMHLQREIRKRKHCRIWSMLR